MTIHLLYFHSNRGQEGSMEKWRFNPMLSKEELEHRCVLSKSLEDTGPLRNTNGSEDPVINNMIHGWVDSDSSNNVDRLFGVSNIRSLLSDDTFFVRDSNGENFSIYFDIENLFFEIEGKSYIYSYICSESVNSIDSESFSIQVSENGSDFDMIGKYNDLDISQKYRNLWVQCENCYGLNYKKSFRLKLNICEQCGYHLKMSSSERIELLIDPSTWDAMDEDMVSVDPIEFHSDGSQEAEYLFHKGLFDLIVPRNLLKGVLSELFHLHGFFHLNKNEIK
uniref:acetyl-CoA carboxylase beta subunit n=1 Tax=Helleborus lividus TaxID=171890 RepID=UPI0025A9E44A|nr:acetyl-CoA carboxylase beta subunit [Helleborus lividus]WIW41827.1 acetyl-CoA carboxylase beta subunit [Helleborus lividus]